MCVVVASRRSDSLLQFTMSEPEEGEIVEETPAQQKRRRTSKSKPERVFSLPPGFPLADRFFVEEGIALGSQGQVYRCKDRQADNDVAVKVMTGSSSKKVMQLEQQVLVKVSAKREFPGLVQHGSFIFNDSKGHFVAMELLGKDLGFIVSLDQFPLDLLAKVGKHMLYAIQSLHSCAFVHRDVCFENFMVRDKNFKAIDSICLIDFGLSKMFTPALDNIPPAGEFRGNKMYASLNAHHGLQLSMRDDLLSLFLMLCHRVFGYLPWGPHESLDEIRRKKEKFFSRLLKENHTETKRIPDPLLNFFKLVQPLTFNDIPDYHALAACLDELGSNPETSVSNAVEVSSPALRSRVNFVFEPCISSFVAEEPLLGSQEKSRNSS